MSSSSSSSITIFMFILAFFTLAFSDEQFPGCSDNFATLSRQRNITNCKKLRTLGAQFGWIYHNETNNTVHIEIFFGAKLQYTPGWLAWGVNPGKRPEMIGTKAIIGIVRQDGSTNINTYDITRETRIGCALHPTGNFSGLVFAKKVLEFDNPTQLYTISASLYLSSDYNVTRLNHVWQVGYGVLQNDVPMKHPTTIQNVESTETIDLTSGNGRSTGQYRRYLREVHGVLNIVGWGTLLPIGVIVARYFRVYPTQWKGWWFYLHVGCQSVGYLIGTAGWAIGLWLGNASKYYTFHTHRTFAIFIFTFTTIQMLALRLKPKSTDDYRRYWNMYHHFLGYALLAVVAINIFKGISILKGGAGWKWAYIGILVLLGAVTLGFEIYTWVKFIKQKQDKKKKNKVNSTPQTQPKGHDTQQTGSPSGAQNTK